MATNSFGNKKFHATNEKAHHALMRGPVFFLWGGGKEGGMDFFWGGFFLVFMGFPKWFLKFPNLFPKMFFKLSQIYPIWFCPKFNSHVYKLKSSPPWEPICWWGTAGFLTVRPTEP